MGLHGTMKRGFPLNVNVRWDGTTRGKISSLETTALEKNAHRSALAPRLKRRSTDFSQFFSCACVRQVTVRSTKGRRVLQATALRSIHIPLWKRYNHRGKDGFIHRSLRSFHRLLRELRRLGPCIRQYASICDRLSQIRALAIHPCGCARRVQGAGVSRSRPIAPAPSASAARRVIGTVSFRAQSAVRSR
jgi:hypothetical protein